MVRLNSQNTWKYLSFLLVLVHICDLFILPFGRMGDSLAYISYGFNLAGVDLFNADEIPFPTYASNPYFPLGYPLLLSSSIFIFKKSFFLPVFIFQHVLILIAQILFLKLVKGTKLFTYLAFLLFLFTPEFHIYPQSIMSEGPSISLHAILILSLLALVEKYSKFNYVLFFISAVLLVMIRIMPFPVILLTLGLLFILKELSFKMLFQLSVPVVLGIILIPALNYLFIGKPVLTTSSGKHFHDRTIYSHKFPLIEGNVAQEKIVSLIGEDKYRRPHWEVEGSLVLEGLDMGWEVDGLLKDASVPYFKLYPLETFMKSFVFTWRTLSSSNNHEFGSPPKFMTDLLAMEHEYYLKPFNDLWAKYLEEFRGNYICYLYLLGLATLSYTVILKRTREHSSFVLLVLSFYPLIGIFLSSCVSFDDPRRLREFMLSMLILALLGLRVVIGSDTRKN